MSDGDEHVYEEHDEPLPVSQVRLGTEEDLQRDFGSKKLLIGSPVTSKPPVEDMLVQPNIPDRSGGPLWQRSQPLEPGPTRRTDPRIRPSSMKDGFAYATGRLRTPGD